MATPLRSTCSAQVICAPSDGMIGSGFPFGKKIVRSERSAVSLGSRQFWYWRVTTRYRSVGRSSRRREFGKGMGATASIAAGRWHRVRSWENCTLADKRKNNRKAIDCTEEVDKELKKRPDVPCELPVTYFIRNA